MAAARAVFLLCAVSVGYLRASPVRTYDQRQQGELNIHAQLDNIVIVLVPASNFDLFGLKGANRFGHKPDKDEIIQFLQKPHKNDIDRYEVIKDENDNDIKDVSVSSSQTVAIVQHGGKDDEKEEEVVATVEEMKSDTTEKTTDPPKSEATEDSPIKEHSTVSESVQDVVFKVSIPENTKDTTKPSEESKPVVPSKQPDAGTHLQTQDTESQKKEETSNKETPKKQPPVKNEETTDKEDFSSQNKKEASLEPPAKKLTIEDMIKPVSEKEKTPSTTATKTPEEPVATKKASSLVEGARREKVIRYKPDTKWAPGLVDMLAAPRAKASAKELEEKQRFAALCSPGSWDTELKTCIMPGETRSRHELARFLEAMRFGIAVPSSKQ